MPRITVCFLWHMHQPFYKDLLSGEYKLPWTRLHALKDYYGMVKILEEFPEIRQTFNLVPSMAAQIEEYAMGTATDPFLRLALKPAEDLTENERALVLQYFFQANVSRMIYRYPRYGEIYELRRPLRVAELRDLQVLSQLAWFDEFWLEGDEEIRGLAKKGRHYSVDDQAMLGRMQNQMIAAVLPVYREFQSRGQIEISTTPYYHPILPLICDTNIAQIAHPHVPLPARFRYPADARVQLDRAREYIEEKFGAAPAGLWPSEGSVSEEALSLAHAAGFRWAASDNGVLGRSLNQRPTPELTYRPYQWDGLKLLFRDHYLSDLIGFSYSRMQPAEAADHFMQELRARAGNRTSLVPVILDGENAWEHYELSGRAFLRELYRRIAADPDMEAATISGALEQFEAEPLQRVFPGSWINANFDVWIGAEEDNRAWEFLLRARKAFDETQGVPEEARRLAFEELLIAEGSDWNWWYGPEHHSANRVEFDQLYRAHLANVYRALGLTPPAELARPILGAAAATAVDPPTDPVAPVIDGKVTSYFEWMGAGRYHVDRRAGAMHGRELLVHDLYFGGNHDQRFLRLDFAERPDLRTEIRIQGEHGAAVLRLDSPAPDGLRFAFDRVLEIEVPASLAGSRFHLSLWRDGLPLDALPEHGWIEW